MAEAKNQQAEEAAAIKAAHPGRCRVMTDVGRFPHVVTVQPMNLDATVKFQLEAEYPSKIPVITVRSEGLTDDDKIELQKDLIEQAEGSLNKPMIQMLVDRATIWLKENGMKPGKSSRIQDNKASPKQHPKKGKGKKKVQEEEVTQEKLASMKTADDVIKRIMWDGTLESDDFLVGYWDRFRGIVEKYFSAFSWEDIASVDYTVLAIPKHRIQYFKYKTEIVWDKGSRLDNVFGSTGSKLTITDVIERYEQNRQNQRADRDEDSDEDKDHNDAEDDDSDSDDGITVTIGNTSSRPTASDTNHYVAGAKNNADNNDWEGEDAGDSYWRDKLRPNYFIAVRITNEEILENLESVQDYILENEPRYASCCIPCASLHVTLCTVGLDTPEQINNAVQALERMKSDLASAAPKEPLRLHGVSNFYNRVVYAKVAYPDSFIDFVDLVKMCLKEAGIDIRDGYEFIPHMTIMKTTRPVSRQMGTKDVSPFLYEGFSDMSFGSQSIDGIHLCSMGSDRRDDGFYISPCHIDFTKE